MQDPNSANNPPDLSKGPSSDSPFGTPPPPPQAPPPPPQASPPQGSPPPQAPPPISSPNPAPGAGSGSPLPNTGRSGQVSLDALSDGWSALSSSILPWIGAGLLCLAVIIVLGLIQTAVLGRQVTAGASPLALSTPTGTMFVFQIISGAFSLLLIGAVYKMALHQLRIGRAEIGQMFNIGDVLGALIVAGILTTLIQNAGGILLQILSVAGLTLPPALVFLIAAVPSLLAFTFLLMVTPLIIDQKVSGVEAIGRSFETMMPRFGSAILLVIVLFLVNILGACACGIGMLFTIPLTFLTVSFVYRDLFLGGTMGTAPAQPNFPAPPIAHP